MTIEDNAMVADGLLVVQTRGDGRTLEVSLTGELDLANATTAEREMEAALQLGAAEVVVDLRNLSFIDSTGIALLVSMLHKDPDGRLRFIPSRSDGVTRVLEMTGVSRRLPLADDGSGAMDGR